MCVYTGTVQVHFLLFERPRHALDVLPSTSIKPEQTSPTSQQANTMNAILKEAEMAREARSGFKLAAVTANRTNLSGALQAGFIPDGATVHAHGASTQKNKFKAHPKHPPKPKESSAPVVPDVCSSFFVRFAFPQIVGYLLFWV